MKVGDILCVVYGEEIFRIIGVKMASIIVTSGEQKGEFLPLGRRTSVIGRAESLPLQVLGRLVSRKHIRIFFDCSKR